MNLPDRVAVYHYKINLPKSPDDAESQFVEWSTSSKVNLCISDDALVEIAKSEFLKWCDLNLEIKVETRLDGTVPDLAKSYEERIMAVAAIAANALCTDDTSEFSSSLRRILQFLSPSSLERLKDGLYNPGDLGDEPDITVDESRSR